MKNVKNFFVDNKKELIILFFISLLIYGYAGSNNIINIDGIDDLIINGKLSNHMWYISVGRWGWALVGFLFNYYPAPFLCLMINCLLFSISGIFLCKVFDINKSIYKILISSFMIAFPINIYAYLYSSWQFIISISYFTSIYSLYLMKRFVNNKFIFNRKGIFDIFIISLLIAFSIGLYQMFICFIITGTLYLLILEYVYCKDNKMFFRKVFKYFICGISGVFVYYFILKLSLCLFNTSLSSYQNASALFNIDFKNIIDNFIVSFAKCLRIDLSFVFTSYISIILVVLFIFFVIMCFIKTNVYKYFILVILLILLLISPRLIMFINPNGWYHVITYISYSIFYSGALCLLFHFIDNNKFKFLNYTISILCLICAFNFIVTANDIFVMAKGITESCFNYLNRLQLRIEQLDGYSELSDVKKYYFYREDGESLAPKYPFSKYAYVSNSAINWSFLTYDVDTVSALNVLGINVVNAKDYISEEDDLNIKKLACERKKYPNNEGIFIYKDIIVIVMEDL